MRCCWLCFQWVTRSKALLHSCFFLITHLTLCSYSGIPCIYVCTAYAMLCAMLAILLTYSVQSFDFVMTLLYLFCPVGHLMNYFLPLETVLKVFWQLFVLKWILSVFSTWVMGCCRFLLYYDYCLSSWSNTFVIFVLFRAHPSLLYRIWGVEVFTYSLPDCKS